jgi:AcrR family transcriptional regulator
MRPIAPKRDRQILAAAQRLFYERGFHAVGMDELGTRAGVTGPAIYRHFSGKDEILGTLFDEGVDALLRYVNAAEQPKDDPRAELEYLARAHADFVLAHEELATILVRDSSALAPASRRRYQRRQRPYIARWTACLSELHPERTEDEITTVVFASLSTLTSVGSWPAAAKRAPNVAELLAGVVSNGLRVLDGTAAPR